MVEALQWACIHTIQVIWQLQLMLSLCAFFTGNNGKEKENARSKEATSPAARSANGAIEEEDGVGVPGAGAAQPQPPRPPRPARPRCSWLGAESGGCEINTARRRPPDESERDPAVPFTAESTTPGLPSPPPSKHPRHYRFFSYSDLVMIIQVKSSEKDFSGTFGKNLDTTL
ncbi:hypothetical protein MSG28_002318 [Choristoneura fumiferana]|uniref:Uncharacterized protein n=1 Tax=Choristoneura fumiferana TaxID=7141 RepID=A0ACC0JUY4_CHOFU|nr:hypothetical protein MSG28_002318 [Choristoneura fumiferana]